jgi:RHS repeat-associated protein
MVDSRGNLVWSGELDPWGRLSGEASDGSFCPLRFRGQWHDVETGLHYNRFRYYDPETARYISADPLRLWGGLNLYAYVRDPINLCDILGLADPFQIGTYEDLTGPANVGDNLDAHELIRHANLEDQGITGAQRHPDNPSIALPPDIHDAAHAHEADIRASMGLGPNDFVDVDTEIAITSLALEQAIIDAGGDPALTRELVGELEERAQQFAEDVECE